MNKLMKVRRIFAYCYQMTKLRLSHKIDNLMPCSMALEETHSVCSKPCSSSTNKYNEMQFIKIPSFDVAVRI